MAKLTWAMEGESNQDTIKRFAMSVLSLAQDYEDGAGLTHAELAELLADLSADAYRMRFMADMVSDEHYAREEELRAQEGGKPCR